jgi:hypothetical protein
MVGDFSVAGMRIEGKTVDMKICPACNMRGTVVGISDLPMPLSPVEIMQTHRVAAEETE